MISVLISGARLFLVTQGHYYLKKEDCSAGIVSVLYLTFSVAAVKILLPLVVNALPQMQLALLSIIAVYLMSTG